MKTVKPLKDSDLLIKSVTQTQKKAQKGGFLSIMLLGTLDTNLLRNLLGKDLIRAGDGAHRAG